jgi:hypothetical protein
MDPTLAIAIVFALGLALSYRAKWKRAERQVAHMETTARYQRNRVDATERELGRLYEKLDHTERLWKDAKRLYLGALDDLAAVRDGAAE